MTVFTLIFLLVALVGTAAHVSVQQQRLGGPDEAKSPPFSCGTEPATDAERRIEDEKIRAYKEQWGGSLRSLVDCGETFVIPTWFHNVYRSDGQGYVTDQMIHDQVTLLNEAYNGTRGTEQSIFPGVGVQRDCKDGTAPFVEEGTATRTPFRFELAGITRTVNDDWYKTWKHGNERSMKESLRVGGCETLNVYLRNALHDDFYGWAYQPSRCEDDHHDTVVVSWQTMPRTGASKYDTGATCVHETGHWLGLSHTFEGGCDGNNIADAGRERSAAHGCPVGRDTCPDYPGEDPIHNYMDYADDCCTFRFSKDQLHRMLDIYGTFRMSDDVKKSILKSLGEDISQDGLEKNAADSQWPVGDSILRELAFER